jgi:hypothetical protein
MQTVILLASFILGLHFCIKFITWLFKASEKYSDEMLYTSKNIGHYQNDILNIKDLIARADSYQQIKMLFDLIYTFKLRYRRFKRYGVDIDKATDELIKLLDERLTSLNYRRPKNKLFSFFHKLNNLKKWKVQTKCN